MIPGGIMSDVKIPKDIRQKVEAMFDMAAAAEQVDDETGLPLVEAADAITMVGRLVLAERERVAKVAEAVAQDCRDFAQKAQRRQQKMASSAQAFVADRIAQAIRSPP